MQPYLPEAASTTDLERTLASPTRSLEMIMVKIGKRTEEIGGNN